MGQPDRDGIPLSEGSGLEAYFDLESLRERLRAARGRGVRVGVLDTGVASSNPALEGCVAANYEVTIDGAAIGIQQRAEGIDHDQHGTAVAGILHAMAPEAVLHSVCVLGESRQDSLRKLIAGLGFALSEGWEVINVSLGTRMESPELFALTEQAFYQGQLIVAARDNHPDYLGYPAAYSTVVGVDMEHFPDPLTFSYRPGERIEVEAAGIYLDAPLPGGGTYSFTGSSFACPQVAGIAARLKELFPRLSAAEFRTILSLLGRGGKPSA